MALLDFQLKALRYPHPLDITNAESARKLVIWLENLKIREYRVEDRKALSNTQSPGWEAAFKKYLEDVQCPIPSGDLNRALQWLVAFALNLEYEDNADKLVAGGLMTTAQISQPPPPQPPQPPAAASAAAAAATSLLQDEAFTDLQDPRVVAGVLQLIKAAQVAQLPGDGGYGGGDGGAASQFLVGQLMATADRCVCEVGPAMTLLPPRSGTRSASGSSRALLEEVPLGFEVEGEALRTAAAALRLIYITDLRRLQSQIDHAFVEMQEYTANPKTDASLGKVGR